MIGYSGTFVKSNGDERTMTFVKLADLPAGFLDGKVKGDNPTARQNNLSEGLELVWDVDTNAFRVYNWNTAIGETTTISGSYVQEGENYTFNFTDSTKGVIV
tara:strand:- start:2094 stop:2399 length:306 start_codon:yes stop_codon:yes gene_type:complete